MLKAFSLKQFGNLCSLEKGIAEEELMQIEEHIKILFLPGNTSVKVDFKSYKLDTDALLFINPKSTDPGFKKRTKPGSTFVFQQRFLLYRNSRSGSSMRWYTLQQCI